MTQITKKPDLLTVVQATGIELKQRGRSWWARCPIHQERTPSFCVDPERQRWKCFGCNTNGDVIDFIRKFKGISFKDALRYLNIPGSLTDRRFETNTQEKRKRELVKAFGRWCDSTIRELCETVRLANEIDSLVKTPDDMDIPGLQGMYLRRELSEYKLSILAGKDAGAKIAVFKGTGDED